MARADWAVDRDVRLAVRSIADNRGYLALRVVDRDLDHEVVGHDGISSPALEVEAFPPRFSLEADPARHIGAEVPPPAITRHPTWFA